MQSFLCVSGYIAAILAGLWPTLVKSVVLMNSAGEVIARESFFPLSKVRVHHLLFYALVAH